MILINAQKIKESNEWVLCRVVENLESTPNLTIVQVEGDRSSNVYVNNKIKLGKKIGIDVTHCLLPNNITQIELNQTLKNLSEQEKVNGIILQLPLPDHLNFDEAAKYIDIKKDVDGLTPYQMGLLACDNDNALIPCTAKGVLKLLHKTCDDLSGKDVVIVNRSHLIGKPLMQLLIKENCTVTMCHSKTKNLKEKMRAADIVITGIGKAHFFDETWFKDNQIIIDCSMNFIDGKLVGDVNLDLIKDLNVQVSSGKGQTGPMTVLSLIDNTILAYLNQNGY